jgi:hypothetical protein
MRSESSVVGCLHMSLHHRSLRLTRTLVILGSWLGLTACQCEEDHPYTPFNVTHESSATASPERASSNHEPASAAETAAAPPGATKWRIFGQELNAPPGLTFAQGVRLAPLGELLFWLVPASAGQPGEGLYLWKENFTPALLRPDFLPGGQDCKLRTELTARGSQTVVVQLVSECQTRRLQGTPTAAVFVVRPDRLGEQVGFRVLAASPGEELRFEVDAQDQDGDGRDDVNLRATLTAPGGGQASADISWLSRPAGLSRRPDTPGKMWAEQASKILTSSVRKKERAGVAKAVEAHRRLYASICAESTSAKLTDLEGRPIPCGDLHLALFRMQQAAVQAAIGQGALDAAVGEVLHRSWYGTQVTDSEKRSLIDLLDKALPAAEARQAAYLPVQRGAAYWLAFDGSGRLWRYSGNDGSVVWPPTSFPPSGSEPAPEVQPEAEPREGDGSRRVPPDPRVGPGGKRLKAAIASCSRSEVELIFESQGSAEAPTPLDLLAPRPAACDRFGRPPLHANVVRWRGGAPDLLVEGQWMERSPNAAPAEAVAWHTELGLLVREQNQLKRFGTQHTELSHECALDRSGKLAACALSEGITVWQLTAPEHHEP